jgi:hypothetical protein
VQPPRTLHNKSFGYIVTITETHKLKPGRTAWECIKGVGFKKK